MKGTIVNILVTLGTLVTLAVLFEAYLWLRYERAHDRLEARYEGRELCHRAAQDALLVYELIPDKCGFNSNGFADSEHTLEKPDGTFRIVLVGDSVAQGNGVSREARFGAVLGDRLNASQDLPKVEMINLARGGYSTSQELFLLKNIGLAYDPDLVIWSYVLNDAAHPVFHDANGELGEYFYRPSWLGLHYLEQKLFEARESAKHDLCGVEFHRLLHCAYRDQVAAHIRELGELSVKSAVPFLFIIHPVFEENRNLDDYSTFAIHEDLTQMALLADLQVVDLIDAYHGVATETLIQKNKPWFDPWHPNELGHRLIGEYLFGRLTHLELVVER